MGKVHEQIFFQRRYANGEQVYTKYSDNQGDTKKKNEITLLP